MKRDNKTLMLELKGEGHTLCNVLREELLKDRSVTFSAYRIDHPLIPSSVFIVATDGSKLPEDALKEAFDRLLSKTRELEEAVKKAFEGVKEPSQA